YNPNNAVLVIAGAVSVDKAKQLTQKWFGDIPSGNTPTRRLPKEPVQQKLERRIRQSNVPVDALYLAFHTPSRMDPDFYAVDLLSDILSNGTSSRLYRRLLKEQNLFSQIDAYLTGNIDPGLLIIEGRPTKGVSLEKAAEAIWQELNLLKEAPIPVHELQKWKNQVESTLVFSETNVLNKAINLAFFEVLGEAELINREKELYQAVTAEDIHRVAQNILIDSNCSELHYTAASGEVDKLN
ncbi:MAG: insulinase family protein, partial [Bacteroidota bacterium]